ncbi:MAG: glycyl radical protein [Candidatus Bipolaricaulota bacterium]|nr:glycyl radical protein [Candidatus Bipolaricaulota bacterium]
MNERVERLRTECVTTRPSVSGERAELLTRFERESATLRESVPVHRARGFRYILENETIYIGDDELIVGERGPRPRATSTYPELCCHSLEDLRVLSTRRKTPFLVDDATKTLYESRIIPFWKGKSLRERVFAAMSEDWHAAFDAGVFTEFMEQRAPGHAILDDKIYRHGFLDFKARIAEARDRFRTSDVADRAARVDELDAMEIVCDALIRLVGRYADLARRMAGEAKTPARRAELLEIAEICSWVPAHAPRTFREALQMYWFVHLGVVTELNEWDSYNPGRLDVNLYPFYRRDVDAGRLTRDGAKELLECFWVKFSNQPAPPKVGVTEEQSATYNDFTLINVGGVTPDGADAVNELSYLVLDVIEEMRLPYTGSCVQLSKKSPDRFLLRTLEVIRKGFGQPSIFNTDAIVQEFLRVGKSLRDARSGGPSGCVEISAFGKESCILTGYMNWPKLLELALHDGVDPNSGRRIGPSTGDPRTFESFEQVFDAFEKQLRHFVDVKVEGNGRIERIFAEHMPAPFISVLVDDCIEKGQDYNGSGPRYKSTYIQGVGMGTATDSLSAIREHVFVRKSFSMDRLLRVLAADFAGHDAERNLLVHETPFFGNDDDRADDIARRIFDAYFDAIDGRPNTKGGAHRVNLLPTTVHVFFGEKVGATPNGRRAGIPLSDGISPTQGADTHGPTAVIRSVGKIDHVRTGGTLLNQRFLPDVLKDEEGLRKVAAIVRTYFRYDGHHIQFNVVDTATLRRAQENPEEYRDLIVRVAGYSDYFHALDRALQEEVIARTAHSEA